MEGKDFHKIYSEINQNVKFQKDIKKKARKIRDTRPINDKFNEDFKKIQEDAEKARLSRIGESAICRACGKTFYKSKGMGKIKRGLQPHHAVTCRKCRRK